MIHGNKHELRRSENVEDQGRGERKAEQKIAYHVLPFTIDEEKRKAALAQSSLSDVDDF